MPNDEQTQETEALAAIMMDDMYTDNEQPGSHSFYVSPQCDDATEVSSCACPYIVGAGARSDGHISELTHLRLPLHRLWAAWCCL